MSFRDRRNFSEMLRTLNYPRIVSIDNFRTPNFPLVAEILRWIAYRYDSDVSLPQNLENEQDRLLFVKMALSFLATKACIKLSAKRIYQADNYAVKELIKVVSVLYNASINTHLESEGDNDQKVYDYFDNTKIRQLQETRKLAIEITGLSASLCGLLEEEVSNREMRANAMKKNLDASIVRQVLANACESIHNQIAGINRSFEDIKKDEANLDGKIEKKRHELERSRKRLTTLQSVRPTYMEDYERLEEELSKLYDEYITKFRNISFLEDQLNQINSSIKSRNTEESSKIVIGSIMEDDEELFGNSPGLKAPRTNVPASERNLRSVKKGSYIDSSNEESSFDSEEDDDDDENAIDFGEFEIDDEIINDNDLERMQREVESAQFKPGVQRKMTAEWTPNPHEYSDVRLESSENRHTHTRRAARPLPSRTNNSNLKNKEETFDFDNSEDDF